MGGEGDSSDSKHLLSQQNVIGIFRVGIFQSLAPISDDFESSDKIPPSFQRMVENGRAYEERLCITGGSAG